jgi:hypothetical protein
MVDGGRFFPISEEMLVSFAWPHTMFGWIVSFHHGDKETLREQGFPFSLTESWRYWRLGVLAVSLTIQTYLVSV